MADYRFVIGREDHVDTLRCEVVPATGGDPTSLTEQVAQRVRDGLRFRAEVVAVTHLTPGEGPLLVPVDGRALSPAGLDTAALTGEAIPVAIAAGAPVLACVETDERVPALTTRFRRQPAVPSSRCARKNRSISRLASTPSGCV